MAKRISKQDATGEFPSALDELKAKFGSLDTAIHASDELIKMFKTDIGKLRKEISSIDLGSVKGVKEFNAKQVEAQKVMLTTAKLEEQNVKLLQQKERLKQQELRTQKLVNQESKKTLTAYQQESRALNEMRERYKHLAVEKVRGRKLTSDEEKEYRKLIPQIRQTDQALKKIDASAGQFQRNVGNYPKVLNGFRSALGSLGVAFGAGVFLSNAKDVVIEFNNSIADLSAITGATGKDLDFFKKQSISLGVEVKGGASAVVEAYKLIASAKPELLENADALNSVTEAAILLSKASGMELPAAATALTDAMNQFGVGADQASKFVDVLAAGAKYGSAEIPQITEALLKFGAVANTTNVSVQESTALIEDLAEKGLKGAEAGTALRNVMLKLSAPDALPKEAQIRLKQLGVNFDDLSDKSKPFAERLELLKPLLNDNAALVKTFGTENAVAASTLIKTTDRIKELTASVDENNVAQEQADVRSKTLSESYNRFKETINGLILEFVDGKDASSGLADSLDYLRENIGTILNVAKQAIKAFILYKSTLMTMNVAQKLFGDGTGKLNINLKQLVSNMDSAESKGKNLATSFRAGIWAAAIAVVLELASAFIDVATGADKAHARMKAFEDYKASLEKTNQKIISFNDAQVEQEKKRLQLLIAQGKITADNANQQFKSFLLQKEFVKSERDLNTGKETNVYRNIFDRLRAQRDDITKEQESLRLQIKDLERKGKFSNRLRIAEMQGEIYALGDSKKAITDYIVSLKDQLFYTDLAIEEEKKNTLSTGKNTDAKNDQVKAYKDANDQIERMISLQKEEQDLIDEIATYEAGEDLTSAIESQLEAIELTGEYSLDLIKEKIQAEYDLRKAIIERQYQEIKTQSDADYSSGADQGDSGAISRAIEKEKNARIKRDFELGKLDKEYIEKRKDTDKQLEEAQEKRVKTINDATEDAAEKNYDNERKWIELTTKYLEDQIDKRIALLDKESEAHQKQADYLRSLSNSGDILTQQSIAEEERLQREAEAEKAKLERRKQYIKVVSAFLTEYTNRIEKGESSTQAFAGALASKSAMEALIESLPAFYEGTESTGKVANPLDSNGGRLSVLHDDERVMTAKQNKPLLDMGLSNEDVVKYAQKGVVADSIAKGNTSGKSWDIAPLLKKLDNVEKAIQNMPQTDYQYDQAIRGLFSVIKTEKRGNTTTRTETQYRPR